MIEAATPENEHERLAYLKNLNVLDTPIEERFERITRIVRQSLGVPISNISLVDKDRQWFKSAQGDNTCQTSRKIAFCSHAILSDDVLVVPDALQDPRFVKNPLVTDDPKIRFYAGYPLKMADNIRIGALCAIDKKPRKLDNDQLRILKDLGEMVQTELKSVVLSKAHRDLISDLNEDKRASLVDDLTRLWNRDGATKLLKREWDVGKRSGAPISLVMVDIDQLEQINVLYGNLIGDEVIRRVAKKILSRHKSYDIVVRWTGERFLIIQPGCEKRELYRNLEEVISVFRNDAIETEAGPIEVKVSIGAHTVYPKKCDDMELSIELTGQALAEAQGAGYDQYVVYSGEA